MSGLNLGNKPDKEEVEEVEVDALADFVAYTSHPIQSYRVGEFQFTDAKLLLSPEDAERFDALIAQLPPQDRQILKKIDREAADKMAARFLQSTRTRGVDTSVDRPN